MIDTTYRKGSAIDVQHGRHTEVERLPDWPLTQCLPVCYLSRCDRHLVAGVVSREAPEKGLRLALLIQPVRWRQSACLKSLGAGEFGSTVRRTVVQWQMTLLLDGASVGAIRSGTA